VTSFASAVTCIDGRFIGLLLDWTLERFGVDAVDVVTEPGVDGSLPELVDDLKRRLAPSLDKHGSHQVVLAGHEDCAGNPVSDDAHREHLAVSARSLSNALGPAVDVLPVFVHLDGTIDVLEAPTR
jgi:hypothetical protein